MRIWRLLPLLLFIVPAAAADTFTEDFESFLVTSVAPTPDQDWYDYFESAEVGEIVNTGAINGDNSFYVQTGTSTNPGINSGRFVLSNPGQASSTTFWIKGDSNTRQVVTLSSSSPIRDIVQFYVFCDTFCELRVRWERADTDGQILVEQSASQNTFKIELFFDWLNTQFCLEVDDVDDGCFPYLEIPGTFGRITFSQYRGDYATGVTFDDWTTVGLDQPSAGQTGDASTGFKKFLQNANFISPVSLLLFGAVLFIVLMLAVLIPAFTFGKTNAIVPGAAFYMVCVVFWLIMMEIWPDWIGIAAIIAVSAMISGTILRFALNIKDASGGAGLVAGSLGYFIIAATFLGFSGYGGSEITLPTGDQQLDEPDETVNETDVVRQSFGAAVVDCIVSGGAFTFGLVGNCNRNEESQQFKWLKTTAENIGNVVSTIFSYAKAGLRFLFQLLTFQFPIPVVFNMMIVLPPAASLATFAIQTIRGTGN